MLKGLNKACLKFSDCIRTNTNVITIVSVMPSTCCVHVAVLYVTMHNRMKVARRILDISIILLTSVFSVGFISLRLFNKPFLVHGVPQAPVFCHESVLVLIKIRLLLRICRI